MRAMILAAGLGTRLRPLTYRMPKPLAPVLNKPVMEHIAELLAKHGFTDVIANVSYMPEQIRGVFGDGSGHGIELSYSEEPEPLGTAGGVGQVRDFLSESESFLVISGDALTDIDLGKMRAAHEKHVAEGAIATLATKRVKDTTQFGVAITGDDGRIQGFQEKPDPAEALSDLANCGIYMFTKDIFDHFPGPAHRSPAGDHDQPEGFVDWAQDVFPALLDGDVPFYSHEIDAYWNDIGTISEFTQGNFDALAGAVELEPGPGERREGPLFIGPGGEIAADAELLAPAVLGERVTIGAGAKLRECVLLDGTRVPAGTMVFGGVLGG
jgi:mannose-1-phosphate guanylyltransferase/mannose-1-phosphate guanylyltransferase/phosphomannomutase